MRALRDSRGLGAAGVALAMAVVVGLVTAGVHHRQVADDTVQRVASLSPGGPCFGAAALDPGTSCPAPTGQPVPAPSKAPQDRSAAYKVRANGKDCWSYHPSFPRNTCHFGAKHGKVDVVLAGNSHAGEWLPALQQIAKRKHWRITTELASQCAMADVIQMFPAKSDRRHCRAWSRSTAVRVRKEKPDLIVFANRMSLPARGHSLADSVPAYRKGIRRIFRQWKGIPVVVLRDTPAAGDGDSSVPQCLMAHPDDYAACNGTRASWVPPDPGVKAAKHLKNVRVADLTDHICGPTVCPAIVGDVIPYFDGSHLTATYSRTLAPYLKPHLVKALRHGRRA